MPFVGIISKENDSNFIKNAISKNSKESNFEIININRKSIENVKNVKFDILVICENIEKMIKNSSYLEEIIKKADYIIVNSDIKENLSILRNAEANIITYGFNAKATITISSIKEEKIIKETKYCKIINQGKVGEGEYTYSIEKIYIKELKRDEVRFCVYKATRRGDETYIPRSLDVTELELIELIKEKTKLRERLKKQANLITQIEALQYKS